MGVGGQNVDASYLDIPDLGASMVRALLLSLDRV